MRLNELPHHRLATFLLACMAVTIRFVLPPTESLAAEITFDGGYYSAEKLNNDLSEIFENFPPGDRTVNMTRGTVVQRGNRVRVVVNVRHSQMVSFPALGYDGVSYLRQDVKEALDGVLTQLRPGDVEEVLRLDLQHSFGCWATEDGLRRLQAMPEVESIVPDYLNHTFTVQGRDLTRSDYAQNALGFDGRGITVAVIDTAFDYTHVELGDGQNGAPNPAAIIGSYDFSGSINGNVQPDGEVLPEGGQDDAWHGTGTSGIVRRYAPGTKLALLKVFPNSYDTVIANAINTAVQNKYLDPQSPIEIINMSLGGGQYAGDCPTGTMQASIDNAKAAGIIVVVAAGNDGWTSALASPGCDPDVIGVGSVWDWDNANYRPFPPAYCTDGNRGRNERACYSNASPSLDVYAPSEEVVTASGAAQDLYQDRTTTLGGTSSAAPATAGAIAQILQAKPDLKGNGAAVLQLLQGTGVAISGNPNPGYQNKRVDVTAAIQQGAAQPPAVDAFTATPGTIASGASSTLSWSCRNTTGVRIAEVSGNFAATGTAGVSPAITTVYHLTADGPGGTATATVTVTVTGGVDAPRVDSFTASPSSIAAGGSSILSWVCSNTTTVTIGGVGSFAAAGSTPVSPAISTLYSLAAIGPGGTANATVAVTVNGGGGAGVLSVTPTGDDFGSVGIGTASAPHTFTVSNTGVGNLTMGAISIVSATGDFSLVSDQASGQVIAPGASRSFQVIFQPTGVGSLYGYVYVPSDAGVATINLAGKGTSGGAGVDLIGYWQSVRKRRGSIRAYLVVQNTGTSAAGPFTIKAYLSKDMRIDRKDKSAEALVPQLGPGETYVGVVSGTVGAAHYLISEVDSRNDVYETNEANNTGVSRRF